MHALDIEGFMEPQELAWLRDQAARFERVVEIGTWRGRSTAALAERCSGTVYSVDHYQGSPSEINGAHAAVLDTDIFAEAQKNLARYSNIELLNMTSLQASRLLGSVDMVFLDGDHTREGMLIDLICWRPKVSKLLCGHDKDWAGVYEALSIYGIPHEYGPLSIWFMEVK